MALTFGGARSPAQVVTGGQAADASAQHDHSPAHWEPGEEGDAYRRTRAPSLKSPTGSALLPRPLSVFWETKAEPAERVVGARGPRPARRTRPPHARDRVREGRVQAHRLSSAGRYGRTRAICAHDPAPTLPCAAGHTGPHPPHNPEAPRRLCPPRSRAGAASSASDWRTPEGPDDARQ